MGTVSGKQANDILLNAFEYYIQQQAERTALDKNIPHFKQEVTNIELEGFVGLFNHYEAEVKRLLCPWELDLDHFVLIIKPEANVTFILTSEPVFTAHKNTFNGIIYN